MSAHAITPGLARRAEDEAAADSGPKGNALRRYGVAVGATALAVAGAYVIDLPLDVDTNLLLLAAVTISAWYGGRWPGIASALLSAIAISVIFIPDSTIQVAHGVGELVYVGAFLTVSLVVSGTAETLHQARRTAETRVRQLQALTARLELHTEEVQALSDTLQESNDALSDALGTSERLANQAMGLQAITRALSEAKGANDVIEVLLHRGLSAVQATSGIVATGDGEGFASVRAHGYPDDIAARLPALTATEELPIVRAARTRQRVFVADRAAYRTEFPRAFDEVAAASGAQSWQAFPLESGGELVGAFEMSFTDPSVLGASNMAFSALLAQAAGDSLARARSYDVERAARREAEMQVRARSDVLAVVAHDLRNPIHTIVSTSQLLLEGDVRAEESQQLLEITLRAATRMNRMVGDLLDATQLQAGHLSLELSDVDSCALVQDAGDAWRHAASEGGVTLDIDCKSSSITVRADRERLLQALGNFIGNAIKFSGPGACVALSMELIGNDVEFRVRDTGPGIPDEVLAHLFERFWQANARDRRGIGLGLAIAKGIIDAHGALISVDTKVGAGTTFSFKLPRHRSPAQ